MLTSIPTPLCAWLTFLAQAVPNRSVLTFLELLLGAMITDRGFVTEALLAITPRRKWPTYFKWELYTLLPRTPLMQPTCGLRGHRDRRTNPRSLYVGRASPNVHPSRYLNAPA